MEIFINYLQTKHEITNGEFIAWLLLYMLCTAIGLFLAIFIFNL